jgi:hypothetical protein
MMFQELVRTYAYKKGMPNERFTFVPHPITGQPAPICRKYLEGNDPITGKPIVEEIVGALTKPLTEEDKKTGFLARPVERLLKPDTPENLHRLFVENGWTDGLPIVLPTEEKVAAMLKGTSHKPDEVVGTMQPSSPHEPWSYTVEKVAVTAVMAGAKPEYFPVILAIAATGVPSLFTSTTSFARMVVVNGPIRQQINMNTGIGALGPFSQANATIGRAWTLMSKNLDGGGKIGQTYMGSQGNNLNYNNACFAEREDRLPPGWKPFHVQKGFKPEESVVSIFTGWGVIRADTTLTEKLHTQIPFWLQFTPYSGASLFLDPLIANQLKDEGFETKEKLVEWIYKNTQVTAGDYWGKYFHIANFVLPNAKKGDEPFASWLKLPKDALIPRFSSPDRITIFVVGGETNLFWQAGDFRFVVSGSVDKWR